jgi:hypothetical protein
MFLVKDEVYNYPSDSSEYTFTTLKICCEIIAKLPQNEIREILGN